MSAGFAAPHGICNGLVNGEPVLFIADSNSSSIRVVTLGNGNVSTLIGGDADPKVGNLLPILFSFSLSLDVESFRLW